MTFQRHRSRLALSLSFAALVSGCGGGDGGAIAGGSGGSKATTAVGGAGGDSTASGGAGGSSSTTASGGSGGGDACHAVVKVGLFKADGCDGEPVLTVTLPIDQPCVSWSHGNPPTYDSATRFQCYKDRLCYTQYVETETCDGASAQLVTDKESRTTCMKDPTPNLWTKILSGTEECPDPEPGFECPLSDPGMGTPGLEAACSDG